MSQLHRLVFTSRVHLPDEQAFINGVMAIIVAGRRNNGAVGVTSAFAVHDGNFIQVLEGARTAVETIFDRIGRDGRHRNIVVLGHAAADERVFPGEAMVLAGRSPRGRRALACVASGAGGMLWKANAEAVVAALRDVVADERAGVPATAPDDAPRRRSDAPGASLDVDRLRRELAASGSPGRFEAGLRSRPEDEALEAMLAVAVFSADGALVRANARYKALLGIGAVEAAGLTYEALVVTGDIGRSRDAWNALSRGEPAKIRDRRRRLDGTDVWLESAFHPRCDRDGRVIDVVELAVDRAEEEASSVERDGRLAAVDASLAVLHLALDGTVLDANRVFLDATGFAIGEIRGRPQETLIDWGGEGSTDLRASWSDIAAGRLRSGESRVAGKDGRIVWLRGTYALIPGAVGRPPKIVHHAVVLTNLKESQAESRSQVDAIHRSHAVITFDLKGMILDANALFLDAVGYRSDEVVGRHHRMFVDPSYAHGAEYAAFWRELAQGRHQTGQYRRFGRDGRELWVQASYHPILDMAGRPCKVIKYATIVTEERLRQAEHQGQIAAIHKAQCVISFDLDGYILDANDNFLDAVGYRLADVRGRHHSMFVDPDEANGTAYAAFWAGLAAGRHQGGEFRRIRRDGGEIWLQATYSPIFDMSGKPFRVVKYATNVTAQKIERADFQCQIEAIRKSQGVVTFALDGTILDVNDTMLGVLGYRLDDLQGHHHSMLVDPAERASAAYIAFWDELRRGKFSSGLYKRIGKDGREVWIQATYNPILDLTGRPLRIIKFASDVTSEVALAEAYEDAQRQAQHDSATALPNRLRLASFMASALAEREARLVVLYIDLDRFKPINDIFGHAAGDRVLGEVADRLRRTLSKDQLVARVGGDEFVVVAPDLADEQIEPFCQALMAAVAPPVRHEEGKLNVAVSIGVAVSPADGRTPDELLRCADAALYRSKQAGRGTYSLYSSELNARILSYRSMVDDLRRAVADGEFFLEYQPRFDTRTRRIKSFEALLRWQHPEKGRINPSEFIPIAEKSGLIVQIGSWVLRTACRTAATWGGVGVSVNLSPVQIRDGDLIEVVRAVMAEEGLEPGLLELEITEGVLLENAGFALEALGELKALGVRLAMDDFGTGYSSLSTLRNFPFDVLKIDRQFISDLDDRKGGREVVRAILALGKALGLSVTAEGVETERQLEALVADACDEAQGYLLGRPMRAERVVDMLQARTLTSTSTGRAVASA